MILNQQNLGVLFTGFKASFNTGFRSAKTQWDQIATLVTSTTKEEKYAWLGQWPRLREWLGDRQVKNLAAHDYTLKNKDFESTISVPRNDIDDDTFGVFGPVFEEMGYAAATHPDELVFGLLAAGFASLCYDGQFFFDTDHPVGSASVSNMQAGAGNPWYLMDTRRPLKPFIYQRRKNYQMIRKDDVNRDDNVFWQKEFVYGVDARSNVGFGFWQQAFGSKATLDQTNFSAALAAMMAFQSDEGRPLGVMPNLMVVGPSNRTAALKTVKAEMIADGNAGVTNINRDAVDVLVVPWLP
ncbi:MAG: Mu-like prophage major head subunit gpT family protein [Gammaproteobacteria bacterium]